MESQITLSGQQFFVGALKGSQTFRLQPLIAPALGEVAKVFDKLDLGSDISSLVPIIEGFFLKLPSDDLWKVTKELLSSTQAVVNGALVPLFGGTVDNYDVVMAGRTIDTWKLLWTSVQLNYADFFKALSAKGASVAAPVSPSAPSTT